MAIDSEEGGFANGPAWLVYDAVYAAVPDCVFGPLDEDPAWLRPPRRLTPLAWHDGIVLPVWPRPLNSSMPTWRAGATGSSTAVRVAMPSPRRPWTVRHPPDSGPSSSRPSTP